MMSGSTRNGICRVMESMDAEGSMVQMVVMHCHRKYVAMSIAGSACGLYCRFLRLRNRSSSIQDMSHAVHVHRMMGAGAASVAATQRKRI